MREKKKIALKNIACQLKEEKEEENQSDKEIWENSFAYQREIRDWDEHGFLSCFLCDSMLMTDL